MTGLGLDERRDEEGPVLQHQLPGLDDALAAVPGLHYGVGEARGHSGHLISAVSSSRYPAPVTPALLLHLVTMS